MADSDTFAEAGHPDVAGYVLGVLDPEESGRFEVHLESCAECRQVVAEFGGTAEMLTNVLPGVKLADGPEPPLDLQARTLARVRRAARKPAWRRWSPRRTLSAAAAAVAAAIAAIALILASSAPALAFTIPLHAHPGFSGSGQAVARQTDDGWSITLTVRGMLKLRPGQFYECWYVGPDDRPGHPDLVTAGTFTVGPDGSATVHMWSAAPPPEFPEMEITIEQAGDGGLHGQILLNGHAQK
jgi:anti-sigma-K factor RskA